MSQSSISISIACALLWFAASAVAQETLPTEPPAPKVDCDTHAPNEERANPQLLAKRGIVCFEEKQYTKALRYYRQAYLIDPSPLLMAAIGRSFQELGYPVLAKPYFVKYLNDKGSNPEGRQKIRERLAAVDTELESSSEVQFLSEPRGATIYLVVEGEHWEEIGSTPVSLKLKDGKYEVVVQREDYVTQTESFHVDGLPIVNEFELIGTNATFAVSARTWRRRGAWLMGISTPFLVGGGVLFGLGVVHTQDAKVASPGPPRDSLVDEGLLFKRWAIVAGGIGLTAFVTGLVFYLSGRQKAEPKTGETTLFVTPNGFGVGGSF